MIIMSTLLLAGSSGAVAGLGALVGVLLLLLMVLAIIMVIIIMRYKYFNTCSIYILYY